MPNQQTHTSLQKNQPLVSFIITYYQMPVQMLQECLDSILQLSLRSFEREIIIIDDGSEKSPINELGAYEDDIIYVRQKNGGVSVARNKGLDIAKGTFIQFVDADDVLIQAPYEQCLDIVRYQENVDMVPPDILRLHIPYPRSRIERQNLPFCLQHIGGGGASVYRKIRSGYRNRPPRSQQFYLCHRIYPLCFFSPKPGAKITLLIPKNTIISCIPL